MTEVSAGYFMDVIEEFTFPGNQAEIIDRQYTEYTENNRRAQISDAKKNLLHKFLQAFEQVNFSQIPISNSSSSISSLGSSSSLSTISLQSQDDVTQLTNIYRAYQAATIQQNPSENNLQNMANNLPSLNLPAPVAAFIDAYNTFMHNYE